MPTYPCSRRLSDLEAGDAFLHPCFTAEPFLVLGGRRLARLRRRGRKAPAVRLLTGEMWLFDAGDRVSLVPRFELFDKQAVGEPVRVCCRWVDHADFGLLVALSAPATDEAGRLLAKVAKPQFGDPSRDVPPPGQSPGDDTITVYTTATAWRGPLGVYHKLRHRGAKLTGEAADDA
jgi:hypothetical protein